MMCSRFSRVALLAMTVAGTGLLTACDNDGRTPTEPSASAETVAAAGDTSSALPEIAAASVVAPNVSATIEFAVRVPGYGQSGTDGWITVSASCGGGGRIIRAGRRDACTDRVRRGEQLRVTLGARGATRLRLLTFTGVSSSNGFTRNALLPVPTAAVFTVGGDPSFDNVYVSTHLLDASLRPIGSPVERRVPIGMRPF
jgi:hypothetical protein